MRPLYAFGFGTTPHTHWSANALAALSRTEDAQHARAVLTRLGQRADVAASKGNDMAYRMPEEHELVAVVRARYNHPRW